MKELQRLGFAEDDSHAAVDGAGGVSLGACLDWLCLNLPEEDLPAAFAPGDLISLLHDPTSVHAASAAAAALALLFGSRSCSSMLPTAQAGNALRTHGWRRKKQSSSSSAAQPQHQMQNPCVPRYCICCWQGGAVAAAFLLPQPAMRMPVLQRQCMEGHNPLHYTANPCLHEAWHQHLFICRACTARRIKTAACGAELHCCGLDQTWFLQTICCSRILCSRILCSRILHALTQIHVTQLSLLSHRIRIYTYVTEILMCECRGCRRACWGAAVRQGGLPGGGGSSGPCCGGVGTVGLPPAGLQGSPPAPERGC